MSDHPEAFRILADVLTQLEDWEDRYRYIMDLGRALPRLDEHERVDANRVTGCASQVWMVADRQDGRLLYRGESDALIVQGLVALLVSLHSGRTPAEIVATDAVAILDGLGLREHLTSQRSNGLVAMASRIKDEARAALA